MGDFIMIHNMQLMSVTHALFIELIELVTNNLQTIQLTNFKITQLTLLHDRLC